MATKNDSISKDSTDQEKLLDKRMPDEERRKILKKLAACAFVAPVAMVLLEGGDNITYGGD